jgi:hypothetical protein
MYLTRSENRYGGSKDGREQGLLLEQWAIQDLDFRAGKLLSDYKKAQPRVQFLRNSNFGKEMKGTFWLDAGPEAYPSEKSLSDIWILERKKGFIQWPKNRKKGVLNFSTPEGLIGYWYRIGIMRVRHWLIKGVDIHVFIGNRWRSSRSLGAISFKVWCFWLWWLVGVISFEAGRKRH